MMCFLTNNGNSLGPELSRTSEMVPSASPACTLLLEAHGLVLLALCCWKHMALQFSACVILLFALHPRIKEN